MRVLWVLGLLALLASTSQAKECFTLDWAKEMLPCFLHKFESLIDLIPIGVGYGGDTPSSSASGRHLLWDVPSFLPADAKPRQVSKWGQLMANHQVIHETLEQELIDQIRGVKPRTDEEKAKMELVKKLTKIPLDTLKQEYALRMAELASELEMRVLSHFGQQTMSMGGAEDEGSTPYLDLDTILALLCGFLNDDEMCQMITNIVTCMSDFTETDFEDNLKWAKCIYECKDMPFLTSCVQGVFDGCSWRFLKNLNWLGDVALRAAVDFLELDTCLIEVTTETDYNDTTPIELWENGGVEDVAINVWLPPSVHCVNVESIKNTLGFGKLLIDFIRGNIGNCSVQVQFSSYNIFQKLSSRTVPVLGSFGRPTCRDGSILKQLVFGATETVNTTSGVIDLNDHNFNETIHIPIRAAVDSKHDGDIDGMFTVKLKVGWKVVQSVKIPVTIIDADKDVPSKQLTTCQVMADPHTITFDQINYNNYYEGHFMLYQHDTLPYEVQAIFQKCEPGYEATCTCAVAVKSGDDVLVVDRCRRTDGETQPKQVLLYLNGELTTRTRIFNQREGLRQMVILPHGMVVFIESAGELINVFLRPSMYDYEKSNGLCGYFDGSKTDDFRYPNGTIYSGDGAIPRGHPDDFIQAWRVPEGDELFHGALMSEESIVAEEDTYEYCSCMYVTLKGAQCTCGYDHVVDSCDIDTSDEIMDIKTIAVPSIKQALSDVGATMPNDVDIDTDYVPPSFDWTDNILGSTAASLHCKNAISNDDTLNICGCLWAGLTCLVGKDKFTVHQEACIDDIMVSNSTKWTQYAVDAARQRCRDKVYQSTSYTQATIETNFKRDCPLDCHGRGICMNASCECEYGYEGADCGLVSGSTPVLHMDTSVNCDTRAENCSFVEVFGDNFLPSYDLHCHLEEVTVSDKVHYSGVTMTLTATPISPSQLACPRPNPHQSYKVALVKGDNSMRTKSFISTAFDPVCYTCNAEKTTCQTKASGYCLVEGTCRAPEETSEEHPCLVCDPHHDMHDYSVLNSTECWAWYDDKIEQESTDMRTRTLRIIIACIMSVAVLISALILYCLLESASKDKQEMKKKLHSTHIHTPVMDPEENIYQDADPSLYGQQNAVYYDSLSVPSKSAPQGNLNPTYGVIVDDAGNRKSTLPLVVNSTISEDDYNIAL